MKKIKVDNYNCYIGFDIEKSEICKEIESIAIDCTKVLFVIDDKVNKDYIKKVFSYFNGLSIYTYLLDACEENKSINSFIEIQNLLIFNRFTRKDLIVSIGGGVTSDLVGFVASTYKRGIKDIYFPTTTLSMIDASIGGKCAINFNDVKNVIGSFNNPSLVVMDLNSLYSLDKRNYNSGLVEALKMGLTLSKELYEEFKKDDFDIERIITLSVLAKSKVVENDKLDQGEREILNFGHSIAHAIELHYEYLHGECVAFGMVQNILNESLKKEVIEILNKMDIDINEMNKTIDMKVINYSNDKKVVNNCLRESYLIDIEKVEYKNIEL